MLTPDPSTRVSRVVRASAVYDLAVTAPFATPWTARVVLGWLADLHDRLGLTGSLPDAGDPLMLLFANLLGSLVVIWSVVRIARPTALLGAADTAGRLLFSLWFGYALAQDASTTLLVFLVLEVVWGLVQGRVVGGQLLRGVRGPRRTLAP